MSPPLPASASESAGAAEKTAKAAAAALAATTSPHLTLSRKVRKNPFPALWTSFIGLALLTLLALTLALGQWRRPVAGVLVDPFAGVTNYGWPSWSGFAHGLAYPDRVIAVDGQLLQLPAGAHLDALAARKEAGSRVGLSPPDGLRPFGAPASLQLQVSQGAALRTLTVRIEPLGFVPWLLLCGGYLVLAWLWLFVAGLSYTVKPQGRAVRAFVRWVLWTTIVLITFFDYHTTRALVPLNLVAYALLPTAIFEFGLCFPERVRILIQFPKLLYALRGCDVVLCGLSLYGYVRGQSYRPLCDFLIAAAVVGLTLLMALRCSQATGRRRNQLAWGLFLLLPVYLAIGGMVLLTPERSGPYVFVLLTPLTALGALGMTVALLRYDLWDGGTGLHRPGLRPLLTVTLSFVGALFCGLWFLLLRDSSLLLQLLLIFTIAALAGPTHRRIAEWIEAQLFPGDAHYRTTVEQLSLRFTDLNSQAAVIETVEQAVRKVTPCERVRLVSILLPPRAAPETSQELGRFLPKAAQAMAQAMISGKVPELDLQASAQASASASMSALDLSSVSLEQASERRQWRALKRQLRAAGLTGLSTEEAGVLCRGEPLYLQPDVALRGSSPELWTWLLLPARFRDQLVGVLAVSPRLSAQLLSSQDEDLLRTIANQAALALACARASEQIESLRRAQEEAYREQLGAALGTLAAEIAHEIRFPINFFRMLVERQTLALQAGRTLTAADLDEDLDIGKEEVARLERMADHLRRIAQSRLLDRRDCPLRPLMDHVRLLLRDQLAGRLLEVDVSSSLVVEADRDALTQILLNLVANALDACPAPGRVGLSASAEPDGRLRLLVWDAGPGFAAEVSKLFQPWFTTKPKGSGLGLAITHRLVRAHGWEISASRRSERTCFDVLVSAGEWHRRSTESFPPGLGDPGDAASENDPDSAEDEGVASAAK